MKKQIDKSNEITLKITCSYEEIINILEKETFKKISEYHLEDSYFVPNTLDIKNKTPREILKESIILRDYHGLMNNVHEIELTKKQKEINDFGEIINQTQVNCNILNKESGISFLNIIGYKKIMEIIEEGRIYEKDGLTINTKNILNSCNLIELEENDKYDSIDKLKEELHKLNLPIDENDYFIKKAELELENILGKV